MIILASLLLLLVGAAAAHAECAWVLWAQGQTTPWIILDGYPTIAECDHSLRARHAAEGTGAAGGVLEVGERTVIL
jgi:hypothetical protein